MSTATRGPVLPRERVDKGRKPGLMPRQAEGFALDINEAIEAMVQLQVQLFADTFMNQHRYPCVALMHRYIVSSYIFAG